MIGALSTAAQSAFALSCPPVWVLIVDAPAPAAGGLRAGGIGASFLVIAAYAVYILSKTQKKPKK